MKTILAIDDAKLMLTLLQEMLGKEYRLLTAADPREGLHLAREQRPDLILCDINMPGMSGGEVAAALADDQRTADIPFVYLTSMASPEELTRLGGRIGGLPAVAKRNAHIELMPTIEALLG